MEISPHENVQSTARFVMNAAGAEHHIDELNAFPMRKRICICGHTITAHSFDPKFGYVCKPGQIWCKCERPYAVYCASDARHFMRSTHGVGFRHALGLGIASLERKGGTGTWMVPLSCMVAECQKMELTVACVDENSQVMDRTTPFSAFLCPEHVWELGLWRLVP